MSVRKDVYQLDIEIITEDSKKLAELNNEMKELERELAIAKKSGGDVESVLKKMAAAGKEAGAIDLTKVAPQQLVTRSRQLATLMKQIPDSAPQYKALETEQKALNDRLATLRVRTRGVADSNVAASGAVGKFGASMKALMATGVVALLALLGTAVAKFKEFAFGLVTTSEEIETMDRKAKRVFGDMEGYVERFAEANAQHLGVSIRQFKELAAANASALQSMGATEAQAAVQGTAMVTLAGQLAEASNGLISTSDANERLRKAQAGEYDGLDALNLKISESLVQRRLQERGLKNLEGAAMDQAKALAVLELVEERSAIATDLFAQNQNSAARATAFNKAQIQEQREEMAQRALPLIQAGKLLFFQFTNAVLGLASGFFDFMVRLKAAAQASQTFQKVAGVAVGFVVGQFKGLLTIVGGLGEALIKLFERDLTGAFNAAKSGLAEGGKAMAEGVQTGFQEGLSGFTPTIPAPSFDFQASNTNYDEQFAEILAGAGDSAKVKTAAADAAAKVASEAASAREAAFKAALAQERDHFAERKLIAEAQFYGDLITEAERDEAIRAAREASLARELEVHREYGRLTTLAEQEAITERAQLAAERRQEQAEAQAQRWEDQLKDLKRFYDSEDTALREAYVARELTKDELAQAQRDLETERLLERLEMLRETGLLEVETEQQITDQLLAIREQELAIEIAAEEAKRAELAKTADARSKANQVAVAATASMFGEIAQLLGKSEKDQKKHRNAIKALRISEILINSYLEVSKIWATYAANPIVAGVLTVAAGVRTAAAVANVQKAKRGGVFKAARGAIGQLGIFGGKPHSRGGTKGYFDDGTQIEVEKDELFAVVNKRSTDALRALSKLNSMNGWGVDFSRPTQGIYNQGGALSLNTTPSVPASRIDSNQSIDLQALDERIERLMNASIEMANRPTKAYVVVDEFETVQSDRDYVARRAAL